ncbi:MAG: cupin domain-containing protein [Bacteroidota bacterium]
MTKANKIIKELGLQPHPEGGYFRETYRSVGKISEECLGSKYRGSRNHATCIYFLLTSDRFSAFHKIIQDEIWHFYDGAPLRLHLITEEGRYRKVTVGRDWDKGEVPQFVVPGESWFAAEVLQKGAYSLVGCTVSPGFSFNDFELGDREKLISLFPDHEAIITSLTYP